MNLYHQRNYLKDGILIIFRISLYVNYLHVIFLQKVSYSREVLSQLTAKKKWHGLVL